MTSLELCASKFQEFVEKRTTDKIAVMKEIINNLSSDMKHYREVEGVFYEAYHNFTLLEDPNTPRYKQWWCEFRYCLNSSDGILREVIKELYDF